MFCRSLANTDITAHVDLTGRDARGRTAGLDVSRRLDQTYFMLGLGVTELEGLSLQQRLALKTLMLPGGLGSTHKVLIFGKRRREPDFEGVLVPGTPHISVGHGGCTDGSVS